MMPAVLQSVVATQATQGLIGLVPESGTGYFLIEGDH